MSSISNLLRLGGQQLTNQTLADMALQEDQAARRARARGDLRTARLHQAEADKLAGLLS